MFSEIMEQGPNANNSLFASCDSARIYRSTTWRDTMWKWNGLSLKQSWKQRLHPHSSEILSHMPTCGADKKHASSVNNYMSCESTAISGNPRQLTPSMAPSDLNRGVTFSLFLSLIVFFGFWLYWDRGICCVVANDDVLMWANEK